MGGYGTNVHLTIGCGPTAPQDRPAVTEHLRRFLRQSIRVLLPASIFFLTGAAAVQRQARGHRLEATLVEASEEVSTLRARRHTLDQDLATLRARGRIERAAAERLQLRQPTGSEIVILEVTPPPRPAPH